MAKPFIVIIQLLLWSTIVFCQNMGFYYPIELHDANQVIEIKESYLDHRSHPKQKNTTFYKINVHGQLVGRTILDHHDQVIHSYQHVVDDSTRKLIKTISYSPGDDYPEMPDSLITIYLYKENNRLAYAEVSDVHGHIYGMRTYYKNEGRGHNPQQHSLAIHFESIFPSFEEISRDEDMEEWMEHPIEKGYDPFYNLLKDSLFIYDYTYDYRGNWITKKAFQKNLSGERTLAYEKRRKFEYAKTHPWFEEMQTGLTAVRKKGANILGLSYSLPATEQELLEVEEKLGYNIPLDFRSVLRTVSADCSFHWFIEEPSNGFDTIPESGQISWDLHELVELNEHEQKHIRKYHSENNSYDSLFQNKLYISHSFGSSGIAIDLEPETYGQIIHLDYEDYHHGQVLAANFTEYITKCIHLIGTDDFFGVEFSGYRYPDHKNAYPIDIESPLVKRWRAQLGLE